jgi:lipoyl(octanoyl) transferase
VVVARGVGTVGGDGRLRRTSWPSPGAGVRPGAWRVYDACMSPSARPPLRTCRLGTVEYEATARMQRSLRAAREAGAVDDVLLLLEHEPVITCGTRTEAHEVAFARTTDVPLVPVERGGKATYHGPGQVVAYPIIDVAIVDDDVRELVWRLEESIIESLLGHGLDCERRTGYPGVWIDADSRRPRKIASVGLRLSRGVTFHGIAINVANDLAPFGWFTPCGIPDAEMTSVARELGIEGTPAEELGLLVRSIEESFAAFVEDLFEFERRPVGVDDLRLVSLRHEVDQPQLALPGEPRMRQASRLDLAEAGVIR